VNGVSIGFAGDYAEIAAGSSVVGEDGQGLFVDNNEYLSGSGIGSFDQVYVNTGSNTVLPIPSMYDTPFTYQVQPQDRLWNVDGYFTSGYLNIVTPGQLDATLNASIESVTVSVDQTAIVPEPSTWAMMLIGFAGLGFAGYRQRQKQATRRSSRSPKYAPAIVRRSPCATSCAPAAFRLGDLRARRADPPT
jgi:hypothetical protein